MRHCDLTSSVGRIHKAMATLREKWALTKEHWNDDASREFEEKHLQPLIPQLRFTMTAVQRLAEVVEKAEKDCEDGDRGGL